MLASKSLLSWYLASGNFSLPQHKKMTHFLCDAPTSLLLFLICLLVSFP